MYATILFIVMEEMKVTDKAATFNGNVVVGKGKTFEQAKADAKVKAENLGSCIRKRIL